MPTEEAPRWAPLVSELHVAPQKLASILTGLLPIWTPCISKLCC